FSGDTYSTRQRCFTSAGGGTEASRSSAHRNADSVFPEPVGATTNACSPALIARHAPSCAAVGAANAPANHALVAGENASNAAVTPSIMNPPTDSFAGLETRRPDGWPARRRPFMGF